MGYFIVIFALSGLILIHELGHFFMARWMKIPVARFSIGFGPKLWMFRRGDTEYRLSIVPIGGYVLLKIEDETEFFGIPIHKRIVFTMGGPVANVLLALILLAFLNTAISGVSFPGIALEPFPQALRQTGQILGAIPRLFSHTDELSGVVGIVAQGGGFVGTDLIKALSFSIFLSLNFAIFNLLPISPLDGGKILLYILERIHPRLSRLHVPLALAGWALLLGLMIYATALDIGRQFAGMIT